MAYYDKLIAAWNGATQPPTGVTGTGLTGGMTTAQKIAAVNGWTVTGAIPSSINFTGVQLLNSINYAEFKVLTATQQQNVLSLCNAGVGLLGGSANTTFLPVGMILDYFSVAGPTVAALVALAKGSTQPWWQASAGGSLNGPVSESDTTPAGLS